MLIKFDNEDELAMFLDKQGDETKAIYVLVKNTRTSVEIDRRKLFEIIDDKDDISRLRGSYNFDKCGIEFWFTPLDSK